MMKRSVFVLALGACMGFSALVYAQGHTQFDENDRQKVTSWYDQHKSNPPAGLRSRDRLNADQESRLREGAPLDRNMRSKVHPVPEDLKRQLPEPAPNHRYVAVGGHVGLIDNNYQVKSVIHLHDHQ
jgi:Ni/Co efflux regulator RcnB